ncbi:hypothetical protein [Gabonia massiliensis]|uniref:hypothetical protein n=1 Tax=Gabonia massiliensis TaxID=1686296 RepID=UPI0006D85DFE|nr:hypothetical protein [Gabonia massiliensis]
MKKNILFFVLGVLFMVLVSATINYVPNKSTGEVNRERGIYTFMDCNPVLPYETLGEVKGRWHDMGYREVKESLVINTKKKYPDADAVIIYHVPGGIDRGEAIKFKE